MDKTNPLSIHIPEPGVRPGDTPDFSHVTIERAGGVPCPPVNVAPGDIKDLAYSIVRILNRNGEAVGPWADFLGDDLTDANLLRGLRDMLRVRAFDQRMLTAHRQGKTSFYMQCTGEEAIACGFRRMQSAGDMNFPTYRQQGLLLATDYPMIDMMCQIYSNERDPLAGRQLPIM